MKTLSFILLSLLFLCGTSSYHVIKRRIDRPIPNFIQYYLVNDQGKQISPWADVEINFESDTLTGVIEIPKESSAKLQMIKQAPNHPLMQDTRTNKFNGKIELRHYSIPLPMVNYGYIPMTWQQSITQDEFGFLGDDDPIDIVDFSEKERKILDIVNLKILGAFCLIDQGQLDWKVFAIDPEEAWKQGIKSIEDVPKSKIQQVIEFFKVYKTYEGKPQNTIGFDGKIFNKHETLEIIFDTHVEFMKLKRGQGIEYASRKQEFNL